MTMFYIILLIVLGLLFLVAELVLLPGVSIGAILALVCYGSSIYLAFRDYGTVAGVVVILAILLLSLVAPIISPRPGSAFRSNRGSTRRVCPRPPTRNCRWATAA